MEVNIRLFKKGPNADGIEGYWNVGFDYGLSDLGGTVPEVGDTIVPYIKGQRDVTEYKVYEVKSRFFRPAVAGAFTNISLVVTERAALKDEEHLIIGGG
jgi:hypothetical protein